MARIVVAGAANLDRVFRLDAPLRHGGRTFYGHSETRWGGGGANTAAALAAFGHDVTLVARISEDDTGTAFLDALAVRGIATHHVRRRAGPTRSAEILVDPSGERTILLPAQVHPPTLPDLSGDRPDLLYIASRRLDGTFPRDVPVIAQLPPDPSERRPAHTLIASRSDFPDLSVAALRDHAFTTAGLTLKTLVVTDGINPVMLYGESALRIPVEREGPLADTIGAGDFFAAGLIHAFANGASIEAAAREAVAAAQFFLQTRPI